ncbi:MAG: DNA-3-methyladenine glycosylase 2 family protein [Clostridia bacterium]|nr:DNA-3-methyladenine glycosylase 2 family protein [Clostridia bacterium]
MFTADFRNNNTYLTLSDPFSLAQTLDCGQAFRFEALSDTKWGGVACDRYIELEKTPDGQIILYNVTKEDFEEIWRDYFDLNRDYSEIIEKISENEVLKTASNYGSGIRVLNQPPWETLCSFIISQNNNIKRIKGIISRLCENYGEKIEGGYTFPTAERLAKLEVEDLAPLRAGFRAKYIIDAARKVAGGEIKLEALKDMPYEEAQKELLKIKGVGPKVADCALPFSHRHIEALPRDVWIKRALQVLFDGELPKVALPYAGIVQQYIFFYARETKLEI